MRCAQLLGFVVAVVASVGAGEEGAVTRQTFDQAPEGWTLVDEGDRGAAVADGALVVWIDNSARQYQPMTVTVPGEHADISVEADAELRSGTSSAAVGLICRDSDAGRYFADVNGKGRVRIGANLEGEGQLVLAKLERPGVWRAGVNRLRLECVGDRLSFSLNGEALLAVSDTRLHAGTAALRAGGAGSGRSEAVFDNLSLAEVPAR